VTLAEQGPKLGDRLAAARRRELVGRQAELALVDDLVEDPDRSVAVVWFHGPGGVGKSSLLRAVAERTTTPTVLLDAVDLDPTPVGILEALVGAAGLTTPASGDLDTLASLPDDLVVLLDGAERLRDLEGWLRRELFPRLPARVLVVVAGRHPPDEAWRTDAGWDALLRVVALRNLTPHEAAAVLRGRGVPDEAVDGLVAATRGHPLALVIAADTLLAEAGADTDAGATAHRAAGLLEEHPDAAARLLGRFVDDVVDPLHRRALHVCGHARRVDRAMLAEVLEIDDATADEVLAWLRDRPYVTAHPDGLAVHEVVRDALDRDLRWRDRDAFAQLHRLIRRFVVRRLERESGREARRAAADLLHLHRGNPTAAELWDADRAEVLLPRPPEPSERPTVDRLLTAVHGTAFGATLGRWLDAQPGAFRVLEDAEGLLRAVAAIVRLDAAAAADVEADPVARFVTAELARRRAPAPGEPTLYHLLAEPAEPHLASAIGMTMATVSLDAWQLPGLGWVVLTSPAEERWAPVWQYVGCERLGSVTLADGTEIGVWARDFARSPFAVWLDELEVRELDTSGETPPPIASPIALSRPDFDASVRSVLRDLHRPDRLAANPLIRSRLAGGPDPEAAATRLGELVEAAVSTLDADARDHRGARALDRTYLRPAGTQERAAEVLGLPFSTYRRHLAAGIDRVVDVLWSWELYGPPDGGEHGTGTERAGG
jgi:hypothetical protein